MLDVAPPPPSETLAEWLSSDLIEALPIGVYVCDAEGVLIAYNAMAATLWGRGPVRGDSQELFCGAHRLYLPDGQHIPHDQTPMVDVMRTKSPSGHFEAIVERPDGTRRNVLASVAPLFGNDRSYIGFINCVQDLTERKIAEAHGSAVEHALVEANMVLRETDATLTALRRSNADLIENGDFLEGILNSSTDCIKVLDQDGRIRFMNAAGLQQMEYDSFAYIDGAIWAQTCCGDAGDAANAAIALAKAGGIGRFEAHIPTGKGKGVWWSSAVTAINSKAGQSGSLLAISRDITVTKELEQERALMSRELHHRLKNTLAMVQAIITQSFKGDNDLTAVRTEIGDRIGILGRAHDILLQSEWENADLIGIVAAMVELHSDLQERFIVEGPNLNLGSAAATAMALALHELATNAQKYGSLTSDTGTVHIIWTVADEKLTFEWREKGGPTVAAPTSTGFGSKLTGRLLASSIGVMPKVNYEEAGLQFSFVTELSSIQSQ